MSFTGYWFLTTAADEQIHDWRERFGAQLAAAAEGHEAAMAWWSGLGDDALLKPDERHGWVSTDEAGTFLNLFWGAEDDTFAFEVVDAAGEAGESGRSCPGARKAAPAAAFYYALGAADAARMPGSFGDFLLTGDEAAAALPELERILAADRQAELIERATRWLSEASLSTPRELVEGVLRVFREASARGLGVAAVSASF